MSKYYLYAFYKFTDLPDYEELKPHFLCLMKKWQICGTIILAPEGLNGTICGTPENIENFWKVFTHDSRWSGLKPNITSSEHKAFQKTKVKLRQEIVTLGVPGLKGTPAEDPSHIKPEHWNELISNPQTIVIDTRNQYEYDLGTFKNAINPKTASFREFPTFVEEQLLEYKERPIAMFCTGGVRCEKSSAYLQQLGFKHVYQLQGGILHYLQTTNTEESLWQGECFVFDERLALEQDECCL